MKAVLRFELIGDDAFQYLRQRRAGKPTRELALYQEIRLLETTQKKYRTWVARITGADERFGLKREFVRPQMKDYSDANSTGSRGVYAYYALSDGIYEINSRETWKRSRRYFVRVSNTEITEITREEVDEWLRSITSAPMS